MGFSRAYSWADWQTPDKVRQEIVRNTRSNHHIKSSSKYSHLRFLVWHLPIKLQEWQCSVLQSGASVAGRLQHCSTAGWARSRCDSIVSPVSSCPISLPILPTAHPSSPSTQLNEIHIFFPGPDSASALLLCTELVHLHPPSPSLHLPAISAWSSGAIPREYHIRCHNTRQIVQQCGEGHTFNIWLHTFTYFLMYTL